MTTGIACDRRGKLLTSNLRHDNEHSAVNLEQSDAGSICFTLARPTRATSVRRFYNLDREIQSSKEARDRFGLAVVCSVYSASIAPEMVPLQIMQLNSFWESNCIERLVRHGAQSSARYARSVHTERPCSSNWGIPRRGDELLPRACARARLLGGNNGLVNRRRGRCGRPSR
jgi:hypothetical protein